MPRNLTPAHLRCGPFNCPSIHQLDSGEYLIVGKSATMAAACEDIPVGEGEHAVIVSGELVAGVAGDALINEFLGLKHISLGDDLAGKITSDEAVRLVMAVNGAIAQRLRGQAKVLPPDQFEKEPS